MDLHILYKFCLLIELLDNLGIMIAKDRPMLIDINLFYEYLYLINNHQYILIRNILHKSKKYS